MIQLPSITMERLAARMLVVWCVVLAIGLAAAAGARIAEPVPRVSYIGTSTASDPAEPAADILESAQPAAYVMSPVIGSQRPVDEDMTNPHPPEPAASQRVENRGRQVMMEVTAYCPCSRCCGVYADGITASGKPVSYNNGRFVAADTALLPFGTRLVVPGYNNGRPVEVQDRGGAIKGHKLDLFFPTHQEALQWGRQHVLVTVLE